MLCLVLSSISSHWLKSDGTFIIASVTGVLSLGRQLDYEETNRYLITVEAVVNVCL